MRRKLLVLAIALPFVVLAVSDLLQKRWRTGIISVLVGITNILVFW